MTTMMAAVAVTRSEF